MTRPTGNHSSDDSQSPEIQGLGGEYAQTSDGARTFAGESLTGDGDFDLSPEFESIPERLGEYTIDSLIGAGGMGRVYKAEHRWMERVVALKTLAPDRLGDEAAIKRFYAEVRATARLLHPNIVTAFDAGQSNGMHYLAMEFVDGQTLSQIVAQKGPFSVAEAVRVLRAAASGLAYAHAAGIIHRDVKPGNIMVARDGVVKVLDLGLATIRSDELDRPTKRGRLIGTFQYIAPEQLEDPDAADQRSDIYALGATFFFLLAGRSPYEGEMMDQLRQHRDGPLPDLFSVRHDVDLRLDHVFQRMMAKRPQDRYGSMEEILEDLDNWEHAGGTPKWLAGLVPAGITKEAPTSAGESTTASTQYSAMAIDLGMSYLTAAIAEPNGQVDTVEVGSPLRSNLRAALSCYDGRLAFGDDAMQHRVEHPQSLVHSVLLYLGQSRVDRKLFEQQVPPEALLGLLIRQVRTTGWRKQGRPTVAALTVPTSFDQLHRRAVIQAGKIGGFHSIRLVDRPLAAAQSQLDPAHAALPLPESHDVQHWVIACLTGAATEAMVVRHWNGRLQALGAAGTWTIGTLTWQRRLVELMADRCKALHGIDPRDRLRDISRLQHACERAAKDLLLRNDLAFPLRAGGRQLELKVTRRMLASVGDEIVTRLLESIGDAIAQAQIATDHIDRILLVGSMTRLDSVRSSITELIGSNIEMVPLDRRAIAHGAAMAAAAELPGRTDIAKPPQAATTYDLGLLAYANNDPQPRTMPVIPRGTMLPARTSRRLAFGKSQSDKPATLKTITVVESAGNVQRQWRSLGTYPLPESSPGTPVEAVYEVDVDGIVSVRIRDALTGSTQRLPELPKPTLDQHQLNHWTSWVEELALTQ